MSLGHKIEKMSITLEKDPLHIKIRAPSFLQKENWLIFVFFGILTFCCGLDAHLACYYFLAHSILWNFEQDFCYSNLLSHSGPKSRSTVTKSNESMKMDKSKSKILTKLYMPYQTNQGKRWAQLILKYSSFHSMSIF